MLDIYIGWDAKEVRAYEVCKWSLLRRSSEPVHIVRLMQSALRYAGLYRRAPETGTAVDSFDGKPFSTEFTFTRFLVPAMNQWEGWALFCDCDFLFLDDPAEIFKHADDKYAAMVVKHNHIPSEDIKMAGQKQTVYPRKNWSSLVLFNCGHPSNKKLTVDAVNLEPGSYLHGFGWLEDSEIGELPHEWNWLEGGGCGDCEKIESPKAVHHTRGGPWFENCQDVKYADLWLREEATLNAQRFDPSRSAL